MIQKNYGHLLADAIRPLDPCNIVANLLRAKSDEVGLSDFASIMPEPKANRADDHQSGAPLSDSGVVADQAFDGTPEKANPTAFDLDMPEPKSNRAEEEKRRQSGGLL